MARDITQLHPLLQYKIRKLQEKCKKEDLKLGIGECFRSVEEQDALYEQGRTKPGIVVTKARGTSYSSQHQWGIAFDIFQNIKGKEYETSFINKVAKIAKKLGLGWGGDWKGFTDTPHFYLKKWGSTTTVLKSQYGSFTAFKNTWTSRVTGNAAMRKGKLLTSKTIMKIPKGSKVEVLRKLKIMRVAFVKYAGKYGYIRISKLK